MTFHESAAIVLAARRRYEEAVRVLKAHCDPRSNPGAHALAYRVLVILAERDIQER